MAHQIERATVIGAGTMGAAIAGHLANAGLSVHLLDMAPTALYDEEKAAGLTLASTPVRNRIVEAGFTRMIKARPANLFAPEIAGRIQLGNLEDDLARALQASDWVIEAIVEQLGPKQALMARLEALTPAEAIISTNTSGLPISQISAGRSAEFQKRFLGIHFFNPPRYLPLVEVIPAAATDPTVTQQMRSFIEDSLGKNVVICHDSPNFIANRMISYIMADVVAFAVDNGYTVEEVDALTGPLLGRPRSATFRLNDIVGIDVWAMIARNLYPLIPGDQDRDALIAPSYINVLQTLIDHGHLGSKSGQGFYQTQNSASGEKSFWSLDLAAGRAGEILYNPPQNPTWPEVEALQRTPLADRLAALITMPGRTGDLIWHTVAHTLAYAASRYPEIAGSLADIDHAMEWGFAWEMGPFAMWDVLGLRATAARMESEEIELPRWLGEMLTKGYDSFYHLNKAGEMMVYHPESAGYRAIEQDRLVESIAGLKTKRPPIAQNEAASLLDVGDGILLLEFHTKMNTLDSAFFPVLESAIEKLHGSAAGLLIANDGPHFSLGANLRMMLAAAEEGNWGAIDSLIADGQSLLLTLRAAPKPVIAAPFQRALGGGAEICLASDRVVAHAETMIGLVEFNVGLIPGWGGCKEMVRRHITEAEPLAGLRRIMELITHAKTSSSAVEAKRLGLLATGDIVVMHRGHLIHAAREQLLAMAEGYRPPATMHNVFAGGEVALAELLGDIEAGRQTGEWLEHDVVIAKALAHVLCGNGTAGWRNEQHFLDAERQHFLQLISTPASQARIRQILATGKPLRN